MRRNAFQLLRPTLAATSGLTLGQSLRYSVLINTEASFMTAKFNGENAISNAAGAALGTLVGFKTESFLTSKYLSSQFNAFTLGNIISGNIRTASGIASSKQYLEPLAPFVSAGAQEATQELFKSAYSFGTINYLNSKK